MFFFPCHYHRVWNFCSFRDLSLFLFYLLNIHRYYYCYCPNSRPLPSIVTLCSFFKQSAVNCRFKNVINSLRGRAFPFNEKNRLASVKYQSALPFSGWNSRLSYGHSIQGRRKLVEVRRLGAIFMFRMGVFRYMFTSTLLLTIPRLLTAGYTYGREYYPELLIYSLKD